MDSRSDRLPVPGHDAARDAEHNGMLDAARPLVGDGRMSLFCVDSLDGWSSRCGPARRLPRRHELDGWARQRSRPALVAATGRASPARFVR